MLCSPISGHLMDKLIWSIVRKRTSLFSNSVLKNSEKSNKLDVGGYNTKPTVYNSEKKRPLVSHCDKTVWFKFCVCAFSWVIRVIRFGIKRFQLKFLCSVISHFCFSNRSPTIFQSNSLPSFFDFAPTSNWT